MRKNAQECWNVVVCLATCFSEHESETSKLYFTTPAESLFYLQAEALAMSPTDPAFKHSPVNEPTKPEEAELERLCDAATTARAAMATAVESADVEARVARQRAEILKAISDSR